MKRSNPQSACVAALMLLMASTRVSAGQEREVRPLGPAAVKAEASPESSDRGWRSTGQTLVALCFVLGLVIVSGAVLRRATRVSGGLMSAMGAGGRAPSGVVSVLGRYPVSRSATLVLLKVDRRVLVICQSRVSGGVTMSTLSEITDAEDVASILLKTRDDDEARRAGHFQEILSASEMSNREVAREDESAGLLQSIRRRVGVVSGGGA